MRTRVTVRDLTPDQFTRAKSTASDERTESTCSVGFQSSIYEHRATVAFQRLPGVLQYVRGPVDKKSRKKAEKETAE
jgi:predicted RNase H-like nuclease